jgi:UDP-glucose 4-epimerase
MVHELADRGEPVIVLDNLSTGFHEAIPAAVPLIVGDAGDQRLVTSLIREHAVDAIIHFAGSIVVPESVADPLKYYRNNTANSRTLIEAGRPLSTPASRTSSSRRPPPSTAIRRACRLPKTPPPCRYRPMAGRS